MTYKVVFYLRSATENWIDIQKQKQSLEKNLETFGLSNSKVSLYVDPRQPGIKYGPEFLRMKADILDGYVDVVCVARFNRISRSPKGLSDFLKFFEEQQFRFISPHENMDSNHWPHMRGEK